MSIRSFIAFTLPRNIANALGDAAAKMAYQDKSNAVRWVDQENYHITLAFLGEQEERTLERIADNLDSQLPPFPLDIQFSHFSPFPESRPKLIAAMIKPNAALKELQQQVGQCVQSAGVSLERRRFVPHLTLGRFRHSRNQFAGAIPTTIEVGGELAEIVLFESILSPQGAEYEPMYRFPLSFGDDEFEVAREL